MRNGKRLRRSRVPPTLQPCGPTAIVIGKEFPVARSPTKKPTRAFSTACWRRSAAAKLLGGRKSLPPAPSIAQSPETEMLRLLSFTVFLATWWGAALLAGGEKLPPPPAVLAAIIAEANPGRLLSNPGVTMECVPPPFPLARPPGARTRYV